MTEQERQERSDMLRTLVLLVKHARNEAVIAMAYQPMRQIGKPGMVMACGPIKTGGAGEC